MLKKIGLGIVVLLVVFLGYVASREGKFHYERSGVINAAPEVIFPYISNLKMGALWSPYEKLDPQMKKTFMGVDGAAGSKMEFDGNSDVGAGSLEILRIVPNELVEMRLFMSRPITADQLIIYKLTRENGATRFLWAMEGDGGYMGKLISALIDCEKMIGDQMLAGIANLKTLIERGAAH